MAWNGRGDADQRALEEHTATVATGVMRDARRARLRDMPACVAASHAPAPAIVTSCWSTRIDRPAPSVSRRFDDAEVAGIVAARVLGIRRDPK